MPHYDFDASLRAFQAQSEPPKRVTFRYGGEDFEVLPAPMLGDTMDLANAPEPTVENLQQAALICLQFIRRMLDPQDRLRFDQAHYRVPAAAAAPAIVELTDFVTREVTGFPTPPPDSSSTGPSGTSRTSSKRTGGGTRSSKPKRGSVSASSTKD